MQQQTKEAQQLVLQLNAWMQEGNNLSDAGRADDALNAWAKILQIDPNHGPALTAMGQLLYRRGDFGGARAAFQRVVDVYGNDPQQWVNLALAFQSLKDEAGEERAITGALTADPSDLLALILRANLYERQGKKHKAASTYSAVTVVSPRVERLHPELQASVTYALQYKEAYDKKLGDFMDDFLAPHFKTYSGEKLDRFADSIDIAVGRKRRFDSQSVVYHYPKLVPHEFFAREQFPWLEKAEAYTDVIREEFLSVLNKESGFEPYISYPNDAPVNQWAELNNSPSWSAFHLIKEGERVAVNADQCPQTMEMLSHVPMPIQASRTPSAMFSLLKPKTKIPPHTGVSNVRVITHLPLIIPADCGFRVGNDTREWQPGNAWVFDDTIEHEAWNNSEKVRVVLIFDTWHPDLSLAERAMITEFSNGVKAFAGETGGFDL